MDRPEIFIRGDGDQLVAIGRQLWADLMNGLDFDSDLYTRLLLAAPPTWEADLQIPDHVRAEWRAADEEAELEESVS